MQVLKLVNEIALAHFEFDASTDKDSSFVDYRIVSAAETYEDLCRRAGVEPEEANEEVLQILWSLVAEACESMEVEARSLVLEGRFSDEGLNMGGLMDTEASRALIRRWCRWNAARKGVPVDMAIRRYNDKPLTERADLLGAMAGAQVAGPVPTS